MILALFDIDGTILSAVDTAKRAVNTVFLRRFGVRNAMDGIEAAGRTDPAIVREMFKRNLQREPGNGEAESVFVEYAELLRAELETCTDYRVMPGIPELLEWLSTIENVSLGIATGNVEKGARLKLEPSGLNRYFPFGGFGSDSEYREQVIRTAIERGRHYVDGRGEFEEVFVVGDTHYDIVHGRAAGATVIAVATGPQPYSHLAEYTPDYLFHDLADTKRVIGIFVERNL